MPAASVSSKIHAARQFSLLIMTNYLQHGDRIDDTVARQTSELLFISYSLIIERISVDVFP